jgi:TolB protein
MKHPHPKWFAAVSVAVAIGGIAVLAPGARPASTAGFAYIGNDGEIHVAAADGGDRQLTRRADFPPHSRTARFSWSPDGSRLVLWREGNDDGIYVIEADGSNPHRVATGFWPAWSPNGQRIAYVDSRTALVSIANANGRHRHLLQGARHPVFTHLPETSPLVWAPGRRIVYENAGRAGGLYTIDPNRATERRLTHQRSSFWAAPSPDHVHVAYVSPPNVRWRTLPIYVASTNGGPVRRVTHGFVDQIPSWSPRGTALVFTRGLGRTKASDDVFVVNADGTHLGQLTHAGMAFGPTWSPDGTTILFSIGDAKCTQGSAIDTVDVARGGVTRLGCGHLPQWRPHP